MRACTGALREKRPERKQGGGEGRGQIHTDRSVLSPCRAVLTQGHSDQGRKKSTKINFLGTETARWGGGLPLEGVVAENFVLALESLSSLGFEERNLGCPGNFAGMSRTSGGVQKVCAKKLRAHFSFPKPGSSK